MNLKAWQAAITNGLRLKDAKAQVITTDVVNFLQQLSDPPRCPGDGGPFVCLVLQFAVCLLRCSFFFLMPSSVHHFPPLKTTEQSSAEI